MIIFSDSQEALRALKTPAQQSGQFLIRNIISQAAIINMSGFVSVRYQWCPDEKAHTLSRKATDSGNIIQSISASKILLLASALSIAKQEYLGQNASNFSKNKVGRFTKTFDKALPAHTPACYTMENKKHMLVSCVSCARASIG